MVIVGGAFTVEPSQRDEFLAGRQDAMRASRAEPGCLEYTLSADPIDPGRIALFERWPSQEALTLTWPQLVRVPPRAAPGLRPLRSRSWSTTSQENDRSERDCAPWRVP